MKWCLLAADIVPRTGKIIKTTHFFWKGTLYAVLWHSRYRY